MLSSLFLATCLSVASAAEAPQEVPAEPSQEQTFAGQAGGGGGGPVGLPPRVRLSVWHSAAGATALGIGFGLLQADELVFPGIMVGGAAGGVTPWLYKRKQELGHGEVSAIITTEQLLAFHLGTGLGLATLDSYGTAAGVMTGLVLGGGLSMTGLTFPEHDEDRLAWTRTGMFGGFGLGALALSLSYQWQDWPQAEWLPPLVLLAGTDLGALAGHLIQPRLDLDRGQARAVKVGTVAGGLGFFLVPLITQNAVIWLPHEVALFTTAGAVGGGVGGFLLNERLRAGRNDRIAINGPSPGVRMDEEGKPKLQLTLLSGAF